MGALPGARALFGQRQQVQIVGSDVGTVNVRDLEVGGLSRSHQTPPVGCAGGSGCAACGS
ncbi:hypothetical protein SAMN05216281_107155 [Cryobacterium luteum]|nr:hypothetical protein SAMN05216281_107155 [Cryobacterium luteum]